MGACDRAIKQFVLQGLATVKIRTFGPAASLIALPWPVKIGLLARIRSARDIPSLRGSPPTKITQSAPSKASSALSDAFTSASSGNAQSSSSIRVPLSAGSAGVISSNCKRHWLVGPEHCTRGDPEYQGVTDLASSSRNGNANGRAHASNSVLFQDNETFERALLSEKNARHAISNSSNAKRKS